MYLYEFTLFHHFEDINILLEDVDFLIIAVIKKYAGSDLITCSYSL